MQFAASLFAVAAMLQTQPSLAQSDAGPQLDKYENRLSREEGQLIDSRLLTIDKVNRSLQLGFDEGSQGNYFAAYRLFSDGRAALSRMKMGSSDLARLATYYRGAAVLVWCTNSWNDCSSYSRINNQISLTNALHSSRPTSADDLEFLQVRAKFSDAVLVYDALTDLVSAWENRSQITAVRATAVQRDCMTAERLYSKVRPSEPRAIALIEDGSPVSLSMCQ